MQVTASVHLGITSSSSSSSSSRSVLAKPKRALDLVTNRLMSRPMNVVVLGAADLVAKRLGVGLAGVGLRLARHLVTGVGERLLGLVEGGLGGVWGLERAVSERVRTVE